MNRKPISHRRGPGNRSRAGGREAAGRRSLWRPALLLLGLAAPVAVEAHSIGTRLGDFYGGLLHPVLTLDHLLPVAALSLLAGQQGARQGRWLLAVFPAGMLAGALLCAAIDSLPGVQVINRISFVLLGVLVAAGRRLPLGWLLTLGGCFGVTQGYGNGQGMSYDAAPHLFIVGLVFAALLLTSLFTAAGAALSDRAEWTRVAVRVAGSWIAAIGIIVNVV